MVHHSSRRTIQVTFLSLCVFFQNLSSLSAQQPNDGNSSTPSSATTASVNQTSSVFSTGTVSTNPVTSVTLNTNSKAASQTSSVATAATSALTTTSVTSSTSSSSAKGSGGPGGTSTPSATVAPTVISSTRKTIPDIVTNLSISNKTTSSVSLNWNLSNGISYKIQWTDGYSNRSNTSNTCYTVTGLTPGVNYTFSVTAVAADGTEGAPTSISAFTFPDIVTNLSTSDKTTSSVSLKWNLSNGISSYYKIQWTDGSYSNSTNSSNISNTSYTVTGLTPGVNYTFSVTAVAADGTEGAPTSISAFTNPYVVANLSVSNKMNSSLSVYWNLSNGNSSYYKIMWSDGSYSKVNTTSNTCYTVTGLTPGVNYTFSVTAVAADGTEGAPTSISAFTKPNVISSLTVSGRSISYVSLKWNSSNENSSYYKIQWTDGSYSNNTNSSNISNTSYTVTGLTPGVNYTFSVTAVAADGTEGAPTSISRFTIPDIVKNLSTSDKNTSSVSLKWNSSNGISSYYKIQWTDGSYSNSTNSSNTSNTSYTVTGLTPGVKYTFSVTAVAADGTEGAPTSISAFTIPDIVTNLSTSDKNTSSVSLKWNSSNGISSYYKIQWTDGSYSNSTNSSNISNTSYTVTGLTPGVNYTFSVTAVAADGTEGAPTSISAFTFPDIVTNLSTSDKNTSSVSLKWNLSNGISSYYKIQWTDGSYSNSTNSSNTSNTSYTVTGLTPGVNYTFSVTAVAADGTEGATTSISAFTNPDVVTSLTASDINISSVFLNWNLSNGISSYYKIQWTDGIYSNSRNISNTSYTVTGLTPGVNYTFSVTAVAADGTEGAPTSISAFTKPEVIRNLTLTENQTTLLNINWTEPVGNSSFFNVHWSNDISKVSSNATTKDTFFNITGLTPGVKYNLCVSAVAADNVTEGQPVCFKAYTKPEVIRNLTLTENQTTLLNINWTEPVGNSSFFNVHWSNDISKVSSNATTKDTFFNITGLTPGVKYNLCVSAVAADNVTEGQPVCFKAYTKPEVIRNLTLTENQTTLLNINWTEPVGNSSFFNVHWSNDISKVSSNATTKDTFFNITGLTPGVKYNLCVSAVAADNVTEGQPVCFKAYTKPEVIRNLTLTENQTTLLNINWTEPVGNSSFFNVHWSNDISKVSSNATTKDTFFNITGLTPGVKYNLCVSAVAADNVTEGQPVCFKAYTKPEVIRNLTLTEKQTTSLNINWTEPVANSSFFNVHWSNDTSKVSSNATTKDTFFNITGLTPGVKYNMQVSALAADNVTEGRSVGLSAYTKPDVIRNIRASEITISSVFLNWSEPEGILSFFRVHCSTDLNSVISNYSTNARFFNITGLIPGKRYIFLVSAFAADNSTEGQSVDLSSYTKPDIIKNLRSLEITSSSVILNWTNPEGEKLFFRVRWTNGSGMLNKTTIAASANITDLTPGFNYSFQVSAVAADNETEGKSVDLSLCTNASPVHDYDCQGPNHTALLNLTWTTPLGSNQGFNITLNGATQNSVQSCANVCNSNIQGLQYSKNYNLSIVTLGCGQSGILNLMCKTGFTHPPVPPSFNITVIKDSHEGDTDRKVTIKFVSSILNSSNGPIEAYGVLLSTDTDNNSLSFLTKNYSDWREDETTPYLTVLKINELTRSSENIEIEIGDTSRINGTSYINSPLDAQKKYKAALVIFTYLHITGGLVDISYSFFSITPFVTLLDPVSKPPQILWLILPITILVIIIVIILIFLINKRRSKKTETEIPVNVLR
ncbi:receptor-type tyrosine-protein phosphatase eta isoform X3 [Brachyhypopomus gauderio]|uniref:receptor-type tyrosine-protein phosphatase eta isoform X3 n=1 Tax=Brachyhypopomus gauderio TaxID=698409 RepID=UPI00404188CA